MIPMPSPIRPASISHGPVLARPNCCLRAPMMMAMRCFSRPVGTALPAILVMNEDGDEGPVNFTVRGETVVVDGVPPQIILRSGRDTATLTNTGPAAMSARSAGLTAPRKKGSQ